jgi:ribose transport system permease protein
VNDATSTATGAEPQLDPRALARPPWVVRWLRSSGTWVLLLDVGLIILFGLLSPDNVFLTVRNMQAMMLNGTEALLLALGLTMLLGAGLFDLSVGANLALSSVAGGEVMLAIAGNSITSGSSSHALVAILVGFAACLVAGMLFGLINGVIVSYLNVNSLIATLGTTGIGTGIALLITNGADLSGLPSSLQTGFGLVTIAEIPLPMLLSLVLVVALWAAVRFLRYGTYTLAIGSSRSAAERAGIGVRRHLLTLMVLTGAFAGLAGFVDLAHFSSTTIQGHSNDALSAVTAVVIGGTLLEGGRINVAGTVWGVVLAVVLQSGLVVVGVKSFWQLIAIGAVLVAAVAIDQARQARRRRS